MNKENNHASTEVDMDRELHNMTDSENPDTSLDTNKISECLERGEGISFHNMLLIYVSQNIFLELSIDMLLLTCNLIIAVNDIISDMADDMVIQDTLSLESKGLFETNSIVYITLLTFHLGVTNYEGKHVTLLWPVNCNLVLCFLFM